jgi:hypothetical protein
MMYLYATYTGARAKRFAARPVPAGAGWPEIVDQVEKILHYASSFDDPGPDRHKLVALDAQGNELARKTVNGY